MRYAALVSALVYLALTVQPRSTGTIEGHVFDPSARPASGAVVYAHPLAEHTIVPRARTDQDGHYSIDELPWGDYYLASSKEEVGYPKSDSHFHSGLTIGGPPVVSLSSSYPVAYVDTTLAEKGGWLIAMVRDAETGMLLEGICGQLRTSGGSLHFYKTTSNGITFKEIVPAGQAIRLILWSSDYEPVYVGYGVEEAIQVDAGQERRIEIRLKPKLSRPAPRRERTDEELIALKNLAEVGVPCTPEPPEAD